MMMLVPHVLKLKTEQGISQLTSIRPNVTIEITLGPGEDRKKWTSWLILHGHPDLSQDERGRRDNL